MHVTPPPPRFTTEAVPGGIRASIPSRKNWLIILFLSVWLVGWAFGEIQAATELLNPSENSPSLFMAAWITGWTLGGIYVFSTIIWQLAGREIITLDSTTFEHRLEAFGLGWSRRYALAKIKHLRVTEYARASFTNQSAWAPPLIGSGHGPLAFDYGAKTLRIGSALEEAEAKLLLAQLEARLPRRLNED